MREMRLSVDEYRNAVQAAKTEDQIHIEIVAELRRILPEGHMLMHVRNEGNRGGRAGQIDGARGQAMAVKPGFPDLLIYVDGSGYCIEVKRPGQGLSKIQQLVAEELARQSIPLAVCRSVDDARSALRKWGIRITERAS
ncbi:VRR-NUC domain-containing protein [Pseudogemmobacter sonorensis]|uniref:VRR-NUC domain-containing protein n=1 Tax=Pseudogemmobacter sonorensis TaxID=2989681 RepID=UPI00368506BD